MPPQTDDAKRLEYEQSHELFKHYDTTAVLTASILLPVEFGMLALSFQLDERLPDFARLQYLIAGSSIIIALGGVLLYWRLHFLAQSMAKRLRALEPELHIEVHAWLREQDKHWYWPPKPWSIFLVGFFLLMVFWALRLRVLLP